MAVKDFLDFVKGDMDWLSPLQDKFRELLTLISGKSDADHKHVAGDILSGILPISRGGTGQANLENVAVGKALACTGNAATATKLQSPHTINGTAFDGSKNIVISAEANGGNADTLDQKHVEDFAMLDWTKTQLASKANVSDIDSTRYVTPGELVDATADMETQTGAQEKADAARDAAIAAIPSTLPPSAHTHDDLYYTQSEVDSTMSTKANLKSPAFTETATLNGKEVSTTESGIWTPMLKIENQTTPPVYTTSDCRWVQVGKMVHLMATVTISTTGSGGTYRIDGLPRAASNGAHNGIANIWFAAGVYHSMIADNAYLYIMTHEQVYLHPSMITDGTTIRIDITYIMP